MIARILARVHQWISQRDESIHTLEPVTTVWDDDLPGSSTAEDPTPPTAHQGDGAKAQVQCREGRQRAAQAVARAKLNGGTRVTSSGQNTPRVGTSPTCKFQFSMPLKWDVFFPLQTEESALSAIPRSPSGKRWRAMHIKSVPMRGFRCMARCTAHELVPHT
jgi:hypothetical protein